MRVFVTGATGFIGSSLVSDLNRRGYDVVKATRYVRSSNEDVQAYNHELSSFDINDIYGCDVIVHLAARVHVMKGDSNSTLQEYMFDNLYESVNLAKKAVKAGVKRFIFVSTIKVNGDLTTNQPYSELTPPNPQDQYAISKWEAEQSLMDLFRQTSTELVIIRPPLVYGAGVKANFASLIKAIRSNIPLPLGAVQNKRSLVFLGNLTDFIITCCQHPLAANQTFLISDDDDVSTTKLIKIITTELGQKNWIVPIPQRFLMVILTLIGQKHLALRLCANLQVDITKAKTLLGWRPPYTFKQGIERTISNLW